MTRTVMFFGDSNTHGTMPMPDLDFRGRYGPADRWTRRISDLLPGWDVIEEGHPGRTLVHDDPVEGEHRNGMRVLPALLESHRPLDVVVVKLGTNDLKARFAVGAADIATSLERVVGLIRGSGCGPGGAAPGVLVIAPPPIVEVGCLAEMFAGGAAKSARLADRIGKVAGRLGFPWLDAAALVRVSPLDGIHYDPPANETLAKGIAAAIQAHFPA
jgi:lysophospholipase L1-like esterase